MDYKKAAIALWQIIDDIDTYSDMAKDDDTLYRSLVYRKQLLRHNILTSDGYSLFDMEGNVVDYHEGSDYVSVPNKADMDLRHAGDCEDGTTL
jgi:hypothetical protein